MTSLVNDRGVGNTNYTQVEPLISVKRLKETYLFGKSHFPDHDGNPISDEAIQFFINSAISLLEHDLDIAIMPRTKVEYKDYYANDYYEWGYLALNNFPVISIESLKMTYVRNATEFETALDIPAEWIRLDPDSGIIRLVANSRFPGHLAVGAGGAFYPEVFQQKSVPHSWCVEYTHGFKAGCVPHLINSTIGMLATISVLTTLGDLLIGAGIASASISLDGLSQSINTTSSAENHGFAGLTLDLGRQLFGDRTRGTSGTIEVLRKCYKNSTQMSIV